MQLPKIENQYSAKTLIKNWIFWTVKLETISPQKIQFMQKAIDLSLENIQKNQGWPFGTVIVKNWEIIAEGTNLVTSKNDPTAHAEINAIRNACQKLKTFELQNCEIYTSCEPCPMCLAAIYWAHIPTIYFANTKEDATIIGFDDHFILEEIKKDKSKRQIKTAQLMHSEALEAFQAWQTKTDKIEY